jgi:hypothetical protein
MAGDYQVKISAASIGLPTKEITIMLHVTPAPVYNYLEITSINMATYFDGAFPTLGAPKAALGTYLAANPNINELKFTNFTAVNSSAFVNSGSYLKTTAGQIKTVDFNGIAPISISNQAFRGCASLTGISFSGTNKSVSLATEAFVDCINLTGFISSNIVITSIGNNAFSGCKLTNIGINNIITMPDGFVKRTDDTTYVL